MTKLPSTINSDIIEQSTHTIVKASIQIVVPTEKELFCMLMEKIEEIEKNSDRVIDFFQKINELEVKLSNTIEWLPVSAVATDKGLTSDAIRKQLQNGEFEEGVDFKYNGSRILINQGAIERIYRKRSSNA